MAVPDAPLLLLRPYHANDVGPCTAIFRRAWHAGHPYAPRTIDRSTFLREVAGERVLVAEEEGRVLGFVALYEAQAFVHHLYVDPPSHGRGIGGALLRAAVALARGDRHRASLKCQIGNTGALAFYRRGGWSEGERGGEGDAAWVRLWAPS